uniref:Uncharacterized protein n=1 Tax=Brassica campestris TaxID=3711 RepID=M4FFA6_BRACM
MKICCTDHDEFRSRVETEKEHAQFTVASDQEEMVQVEKSGTETQDGVELKDHSTPPSCFKHSPISTSQKDSYTIFSHSSPDATSISASTLAGSSTAQTSLQIMEGVSSDIIFNEANDEFGSVTRQGRLIKPTQKFQGMEWMTVRGRGKRSRRGRDS